MLTQKVTIEKIEQLVDMISELTVLDLSKLKKALEDKWDVKAVTNGPVMMTAPPVSGSDSDFNEPTDFQVILEKFPADKKIVIIKIIREVTELGLRESKELVEGAPKVVKDSASKYEAEEIKKKLTDAGAEVVLKGI